MNKINQFFLNQGNTVRTFIEAFFEHDVDDVLDYAYSPEIIEKYLIRKREKMNSKILDLIKNKSKYLIRETDDQLTKYVIEEIFYYEFELNNFTIQKFKNHIKKCSFEDLQKYYNYFIEGGIFKLKKEK